VISTDDLATAGVAILRVKAQVALARGKVDAPVALARGRLTEAEARELANAADTLAYHATLMRNELLKRSR
jgi:hypothetical protein